MQDKKPYNDKDERHGLWEVYHKNGNIRYKGEYVNGKRHRPWTWYYSNGNLRYKGEFKNARQIGFWVFYKSTTTGHIKQKFYAK